MSAASIIIIIDELQAKLVALKAVDLANMREGVLNAIESRLQEGQFDVDSACSAAGIE